MDRVYNTTGSVISLTGWKIVDDSGAQTYNLSGTIAAGGYYLIERAATRPASRETSPSQAYLANTGDSFELQDAGRVRVDWVNYKRRGLVCRDDAGYYSMERKLATGGGSTASNWATTTG